jgi:MtN3 and saliva related transmembrane protein
MNNPVEWIGFLAGSLTTISFIPQVIKVWQTKSTHDISLIMYSLFCAGVFVWVIFGFYIQSASVVFFNAVTLVLALTILFFKIVNR